MRVLVAPDSFGASLTAREAAQAIATGWARTAPDDELHLAPMSDGGPGFIDALEAGRAGLDSVPVSVLDPLGRVVAARVLRDGAVAYVESAQACG
ncbi:MAG: glycerate kinase, partial [Geodermatophilaceae bacterium]|nr:glycerate kinase [Geodermatophilaceae bacterium]